MKQKLLAVLSALMLAGCSLVGERSGYEAPAYEVVERLGDTVEVRRYGPRLVADAAVPEAEAKGGANRAFRLLFAYISGENRAGDEVAMTVPVAMASGKGEAIAMTVPVEQAAPAARGTRMRFFFPARYTRETAPQPLDERVTIAEVPGETVMVLRYSGFNGPEKKARQAEELGRLIAGSRWQPAGPPVFLAYDPPWTLPLFRRHEVLRPVVPR